MKKHKFRLYTNGITEVYERTDYDASKGDEMPDDNMLMYSTTILIKRCECKVKNFSYLRKL